MDDKRIAGPQTVYCRGDICTRRFGVRDVYASLMLCFFKVYVRLGSINRRVDSTLLLAELAVFQMSSALLAVAYVWGTVS